MQQYLALITVLGQGGYPDNSLPPGGVGVWPSPGHPAHPIAPGGQPPGIWPSPGHPAHPIAPGGQPPGIWPSPGRPDNSLPIPPGIWPSPGRPDQGLPPSGVGIWPSPGQPAHPIVILPGPEVPPGEVTPDKLEWHSAWTPELGWFVVGVPKAGTELPTPSAAKPATAADPAKK